MRNRASHPVGAKNIARVGPLTSMAGEKKKEEGKMDALKEIAERNRFIPYHIGKEVLEKLGYKVEFGGFGYNSLWIRVTDPTSGRIVFEEKIGL